MNILKSPSLLFLLPLLMIGSTTVNAQQEDDPLSLIKAPVSPGSTILGLNPSNVNRPKSWEALETTLYSGFFSGTGNNLPGDFGLEFSPYWAGNNPVPLDQFLRPSVGTSLEQNLSFSIASTNKYVVHDTLETGAMGFGVRTMLWQGSKNENAAIVTSYGKLLTDLGISNRIYQVAATMMEGKEAENVTRAIFVNELASTLILNQDNIFAGFQVSDGNLLRKIRRPYADYSAIATSWIQDFHAYLLEKLGDVATYEEYSEALADLVDEFVEVDYAIANLAALQSDRKGFKLEVAGALALNFPTNETDYSVISKWGFWLTPSYQPFKSDWFELLGVARFYWHNTDFYKAFVTPADVYNYNLDFGLRGVLKKGRVSFEAEMTGRYANVILDRQVDDDGVTTTRSRTSKDYQYLFNVNYRINERMIVSYNFGKQFDPLLAFQGNLISMLSLNFGVGAPTVKDLK